MRAATQLPVLQASPLPQEVPSATKVRSVHTGPFAHSMVAVAAQGFVDVQVVPCVQRVQVPFEAQTLPAPQGVPGVCSPWSAQTGTPVEHWMAAERAHGLVGVQDAPAVQEAQTCADEQYRSAGGPHPAPAGSQLWSVQTGVPVPQAMVATEVQGFAEVQSAPCVHAVQTPPLHTWFTPQEVPFETAVVVSTHTGSPDPQAIAPVRQVFRGVQASPGVQGRHWWAALQTSPVPQEVPAGTKPVSVHTGVPEPQAMVAPAEHGLVDAQGAPSEQASQTPAAEQTSPAPQVVPGGWLVRSVQTAAPLEHS